MKRVATLILATLALSGAVFVTGAAGHKVKFDTTVTAKFNKADKKDPYAKPANFDGSVNSAKRRCIKNRTVTLRLRAANGTTSVVGTDLTDASGAWLIAPTSVAPGTYFAKVTKRVLRKNTKHRHTCRRAVSKDVKVK
ncbi:MAG: hypothetical protein ABIZ50_04770 [Solirubrobacterales bacterium]